MCRPPTVQHINTPRMKRASPAGRKRSEAKHTEIKQLGAENRQKQERKYLIKEEETITEIKSTADISTDLRTTMSTEIITWEETTMRSEIESRAGSPIEARIIITKEMIIGR